MAKRNIISIDEKEIQNIIAGDLISPVSKGGTEMPKEKSQGKQTGKTKDISLSMDEYEEKFLAKKSIPNSRHTSIYVNNETFERVSFLLNLAGNGLTFSGFISSILEDHLESNEEAIRTFCNSRFEMFKKKDKK